LREQVRLPVLLAGHEQTVTLRSGVYVEVAAGGVTLKSEVRLVLFAVTTGIGIAGRRGGGKIGGHARFTGLDATVRSDGYPGGSSEVEKCDYESYVTSHTV
jgi:hypothetical protein